MRLSLLVLVASVPMLRGEEFHDLTLPFNPDGTGGADEPSANDTPAPRGRLHALSQKAFFEGRGHELVPRAPLHSLGVS